MTSARATPLGRTSRPPPSRASAAPALAVAFLFAACAASGGEPLRTAGGEIVARRPSAAAWSCEATSRAERSFRLAELRCGLPVRGGSLYLYAKDYDGPSETVEGICAWDFRSYYRPLFREISRLDAKVTGAGEWRACAVDAEGTSPSGRRDRVREWYGTARGHVLLVSAAGPADAMAANDDAIAAWRKGVRFRAAAPR